MRRQVPASVPTRIRSARVEAGLTREQMAPKVGVTLRTLARWENGETERISFASLQRVANATGKHVSWFFGDAA